MNAFKRKKILVTHPGVYHTDDLFASAVFSIHFGGKIKIIRTSDKAIIDKADFVYDTGGVYDKEKGRFDHHQKDGPVRENGIPFASLGLVWERFGEEICGNKEVAKIIENKIVIPVDIEDNGLDLFQTNYDGINPYSVSEIFKSEIPTWKEYSDDIDRIFIRQVKKATELLKREIKIAKDDVSGMQIIENAYNLAEDKRIIKIDENLPRYLYQDVLSTKDEPVYVILQSRSKNDWKVEAIRKDLSTKASRKPFPESWRGEMDLEKLKELTGVSEVVFCHRSGFLVGVSSLEGAMKLAQKALIA